MSVCALHRLHRGFDVVLVVLWPRAVVLRRWAATYAWRHTFTVNKQFVVVEPYMHHQPPFGRYCYINSVCVFYYMCVRQTQPTTATTGSN